MPRCSSVEGKCCKHFVMQHVFLCCCLISSMEGACCTRLCLRPSLCGAPQVVPLFLSVLSVCHFVLSSLRKCVPSIPVWPFDTHAAPAQVCTAHGIVVRRHVLLCECVIVCAIYNTLCHSRCPCAGVRGPRHVLHKHGHPRAGPHLTHSALWHSCCLAQVCAVHGMSYTSMVTPGLGLMVLAACTLATQPW